MYHCGLARAPLLLPKEMTIPAEKAAEDKERSKLTNLPAWDESKVRGNADVIRKAQNKKNPVHSAALMDVCHLKHSELAEHLQ